MTKILNEDIPFCCPGIRSIRGDYFLLTDTRTPLRCRRENSYSFACKTVWFCPCCGKMFSKCSQPVKPASNQDFCCDILEFFTNKSDPRDEYMIFYQPFVRRFYFSTDPTFLDGHFAPYAQWDFYFCIYCGSKHPESLVSKWFEIATKELGLEWQPSIEKMLPLMPEEFQTDQWWKKRGL